MLTGRRKREIDRMTLEGRCRLAEDIRGRIAAAQEELACVEASVARTRELMGATSRGWRVCTRGSRHRWHILGGNGSAFFEQPAAGAVLPEEPCPSHRTSAERAA